jgi:leucyl-tRNA synthetase
MKNWMPVDHYNGGNEHNTRHLIYSRFWYKALYDLGHVPTPEPYKKRTTNGLLMGTDGKKMSKSRGNGFLVSEKLADIGADAARMTVLSLGPWEQNIIWSEGALAGVQRFLKRVENMQVNDNVPDEFLQNQLIRDCTTRIENMQFNTAISAMMSYVNEFSGGMPRANYETLLQMLNPFAPHLTEEMWENLGHAESLVFEPWPTFDVSKLVKNTITMSVSVNGKLRGTIDIALDAAQDDIIAAATPVAEKYLTGEIVKTIVVPRRMVNFVVK